MALIPKLPAGPIQTIPQGLLGLLQLKETGHNPDVLNQQVSPNLDIGLMYLERVMQTEAQLFGGVPQTTAIANAQHGFIQFQVAGVAAQIPNNETWFVVGVSAIILLPTLNTLAAGDTIVGGVCWNISGTTSQYLFHPLVADIVTARARSWIPSPMTSVPGRWLPPGCQFSLYVADISVAAGTYTFQLAMRAARVPI